MFESTPGADPLAALTSNQLAAAVESNHAALLAAENRLLQLAAAWADVHTVDENAPYGPLVERSTILGGRGTPPVAEFCCAEFGALTGTGMIAAQHLIADALDCRHRLPLLWERIQGGQIRAWKARKIAAATRHLPREACADVDHAVHGFVETLPWPRFEKVLAAAIVDADPALAAERETQARTRRGVWATRSEEGLRTVIAKATAGDAVVFMATLNRIADILASTDEVAGPRHHRPSPLPCHRGTRPTGEGASAVAGAPIRTVTRGRRRRARGAGGRYLRSGTARLANTSRAACSLPHRRAPLPPE